MAPSSSKHSSKHQKNERRAANSVISLTQFAHAKSRGTRRAIENYKQKKQTKFNHNASLLREYRKAMKNEGYEAGKGASRKRSLSDNDNNDDIDGNLNDQEAVKNDAVENINQSNQDKNERKKKRHKSDPLAKAKQKAKQSKIDQKEREEMRIKSKEDNQRKIKLKKERAKKLAKRTRKGQPIMKNVVGDLLKKIRESVDE